VRVGGPIPSDAEKWRLISESACYIAPSYMEHFGMAVRESLSVGVPTVVYALPVFADIRGHPCLIEVPVGNVSALADALGQMLNLTEADRALLAASSMSYRVGPTWQEAAQRELGIIDSCAHLKFQ
jgi:glycosyltransferase involved in cell wall biosynthesis